MRLMYIAATIAMLKMPVFVLCATVSAWGQNNILISPNVENRQIIAGSNPISFPFPQTELDLRKIQKKGQMLRPVEISTDKDWVVGRARAQNPLLVGVESDNFRYTSDALDVVKVLTNEGHGSGIFLTGFKLGEANIKGPHIITNYHVIDGYGEVGVQFHPQIVKKGSKLPKKESLRVYIGKVVKFDEIKDLALIKLTPDEHLNNMTRLLRMTGAGASLGLSALIEVGQDVHAIGHPFGEDWTYTRGYISQTRAEYSWNSGLGKHHVADVIQTQTPINPGNSGGPLFDNEGLVIGVTTFGKAEPGAEGINFAVSIKEVKNFLTTNYNRKAPAIAEKLLKNLMHTDDSNKNGTPDFYVWDDNQNSVADAWGYDEDEDNLVEKIYFDPNENKIADVAGYLFHDINGNYRSGGGWVFVYQHDDDENGEFDRISIDIDLDGEIDITY